MSYTLQIDQEVPYNLPNDQPLEEVRAFSPFEQQDDLTLDRG